MRPRRSKLGKSIFDDGEDNNGDAGFTATHRIRLRTQMRFFVIMACHNRRDLTVRSISRAQAAADIASIDVSFTVFDDGSSDGTAQALRDVSGSAIQTITGDGSAFWARSMATAESQVLGKMPDDENAFVVWLNDDVLLDIEAFRTIRPTLERNANAVVVGAMRETTAAEVSYSGMRRAGFHPLHFAMVQPADQPQEVDTFNGNLVVVPLLVARRLGGIDGGYSHGLADIDYGLRCGRANIRILLAPGTYGICPRNPAIPRGGTREDWLAFTGAKGGGNFLSLKRVLRKSHGRAWLAFIALTYSTWWVRRAFSIGANRGSPR